MLGEPSAPSGAATSARTSQCTVYLAPRIVCSSATTLSWRNQHTRDAKLAQAPAGSGRRGRVYSCPAPVASPRPRGRPRLRRSAARWRRACTAGAAQGESVAFSRTIQAACCAKDLMSPNLPAVEAQRTRGVGAEPLETVVLELGVGAVEEKAGVEADPAPEGLLRTEKFTGFSPNRWSTSGL